MKTLFNHHSTTKELCAKHFSSSLSLRRLSRVLSSLVRKSHSQQIFAHVSRAMHAIQVASKTSTRAYLGLLLVALGPLVEVAYRLFDQSAGLSTDYWNSYYFLFAVRSDLSTLFYVTGGFLLLPQFSKGKLIFIVPASYKFARICWMAFVTNNEQYHQFVPMSFLAIGFALAVFYFLVFEWLMSLHYHKRAGHIARAEGILQTPGVDDKAARQIALLELIALRKLQ